MTETDYKLLDRYLADECTSQEQQAVEARLQTDADFAEAHRFRLETERFLRSQANEPALLEVLGELGPRHFSTEAAGAPKTQAKVRSLWPRLLAVAAAVALLLVVWQPWAGERDLYAAHVQHPPFSFTTRGATAEQLQLAEAAMRIPDYEAAYTALAELPDSVKREPNIVFGRGVAALETERYAEAQLLFKQLSQGDSALQEYGIWYEALTQLKAGNDATALQLLKTMTLSDPVLRKRAQALREELE